MKYFVRGISVIGILSVCMLSGCSQNWSQGKSSISLSDDIQKVSLKKMKVRSELPTLTLLADRSLFEVENCLREGIRSFNIPDDYLVSQTFLKGKKSIGLVNPVTGDEGLSFDLIVKSSQQTKINFYSNGFDVSKKWQSIVTKCGKN